MFPIQLGQDLIVAGVCDPGAIEPQTNPAKAMAAKEPKDRKQSGSIPLPIPPSPEKLSPTDCSRPSPRSNGRRAIPRIR